MKIVCRLLILLVLMIAGCTPGIVTTPIETVSPSLAVPTQLTEPPIDTPQPSPTPQPGKVILLTQREDAQAVQVALTELASNAGLSLEIVQDLQQSGITADVRIVVMLTPPANLNDLMTANPQVQFVVVSGVDLDTLNNLTVIRWRPESQAFLGGFISVLLSTDWRSAGLLPSDSPLGDGLRDAFVNGGRYYCGVCGPGWPLGVYYPQTAQLPAVSDGVSWQTEAASLFDNMKVEVFYLSSESVKPEVIAFLQGRDQFGKRVLVIGTQPPPDELRSQWAATVNFDIVKALNQAWPDVLKGTGGVVIEPDLVLTDVNQDNLGEGKLRLINELMDEIQAGRVFPFSVPQE